MIQYEEIIRKTFSNPYIHSMHLLALKLVSFYVYTYVKSSVLPLVLDQKELDDLLQHEI